ncbi:MAG: hypothetical protein UU77_C0032G0002 [candidate division WWE3 bacterium GW2011_GWC1_41_7]|uniref:RDD domain-containing protein n=3 Tax=Katanobacteria TaxID=422282 RepID=A0A0G0X6W0_UNCKA|nr:MAG: hypothetical protein UU72_C0001G0025 [candidate division WWE3 bacterium GW2011_GWB1_41_6]KKS20097.1 MAG: hypothetical protein UU77_C0032G0002 [candidate division WWE3 bacterium GW2011_GWC1_41_7]KKS22446.1 MAG: hypothetical protein UU80_C0007G0030 [candidate division WWE3 bacterium GW2011_GWA1_41_8]
MDDQNFNNETFNQTPPEVPQEPAHAPEATPVVTEQPVAVAEQPPATPAQPPVDTSGVTYATFFQRFVAGLIDFVLVGIVTTILGAVLGFANADRGFVNPFSVLAWAYYIYMVVKYGATVGKMAMGLRVQNETTGANLSWLEAFLREVVGKLLSGLALGLGFLWMLWDPKKQTWHDKIAKSIVVKVK